MTRKRKVNPEPESVPDQPSPVQEGAHLPKDKDFDQLAQPRSYKVGVKTHGDKDWVYNGLRFPTKEAAKRYESDLLGRWFAVKESTITPCDDEPTEK